MDPSSRTGDERLHLTFNRLLPKCNDRNKNQNDLFHSENWPITPKNWPISALFGVKNVVNFSNSSRQYSVNGKAKLLVIQL